MYEAYLAQKVLASMKMKGDDDFMARSPAPVRPAQAAWKCRVLCRLGDLLIEAGLRLKRHHTIEQPAIPAYS